MIFGKTKKLAHDGEGHLWQPFSDLFANLMFVFILAMGAIAFQLKRSQSDLIAKQTEIDRSITSVKKKREEIISRMLAAFKNQDRTKVQVDSSTGALKFPGEALFDQNSSTINSDSKPIFRQAVNQYFDVLLDTTYKDFIQTIEIEGHTDSDPIRFSDPYSGNLKLSQDRAFMVMIELLDIRSQDVGYLRQKVSASGFSFSKPVLDGSGKEDKPKSRRIEIKFRVNETALLNALEKLVTPSK